MPDQQERRNRGPDEAPTAYVWCEKFGRPMLRHDAVGREGFARFVENPCDGTHRRLLLGDEVSL